jgi:hypothetical protein
MLLACSQAQPFEVNPSAESCATWSAAVTVSSDGLLMRTRPHYYSVLKDARLAIGVAVFDKDPERNGSVSAVASKLEPGGSTTGD